MAIHFNSQKERLAFLRGEYEEIIPQKATETPKKAKNSAVDEEKPRKKASKPKKTRKKKEKDDEVQAK